MLNQEQVLHKITDVAKLNGEFFLRSLYYLLIEGSESMRSTLAKRPISGEVNYNRFMNSESTKLVENFKASELHVASLKDYLKQYGVAFAVKEQADGYKTLIFEAKNKAVVEEAFSQTIAKLTKETEGQELLDDLKLTPRKLPLEERIKYFEAEMAQEIAMSQRLGQELGQSVDVVKEKSL